MPAWFYPLMLVVILAGYVFLFLQGRQLRDSQRDIVQRLTTWETRLRRELAVLTYDGGSRENTTSTKDAPPLEAMIAAQSELLAELHAAVGRLSQSALRPRRSKVRPHTAAKSETRKVVRMHFGAEGFDRVHIIEQKVCEDGERLTVRVKGGDTRRVGHVFVRAGRVTDVQWVRPVVSLSSSI